VLLALLLPDPCDENCPDAFKKAAREILSEVRQPPKTDEDLQKALLWFLGTFASWDMAANNTYLRVGRDLVRAAYPDEPPLVVDPFAGGGSIPLEALRLGCDAFASDLNPVACLNLKVLLEVIPRHGPKLAEELRRVGKEIKEQAARQLADFYPKSPDGATPIAYLWARTVRCESPNCGAEIPLARSFWLCKKPGRKWALRYRVVRSKGDAPCVEFEVFQPKLEKDVPTGTVTRAKATCICCNTVLAPDRVRAQLSTQRGGADVAFDSKGRRTGGARMLAVVALKTGEQGRHYRLPEERDYRAVWKAQQQLAKLLQEWERAGKHGPCPIPDEPTPAGGGSGAGRAFSVQKYGMLQWGDLFTARQKVALACLCELNKALAPGNTSLLSALAVSRCTDQSSSLVRWRTTVEAVAGTFGRQALPIMWDFAEIIVTGEFASNFAAAVNWVADVVEGWRSPNIGQVQNADATAHPLPSESAAVWFTDPPYYDAVPYADLSDFFLVWLKRALNDHPLLKNSFEPDNALTPKTREVVQDETKRVDGHPKDRAWFEEAMAQAFAEGRRVLSETGIGSVVFAHKTTEGWEALLSGITRGGWTVTGSWPIATERPARLRSQDSAALATSVHLVCRPRPDDAAVGDWAAVLKALPVRVGEWMERLQYEGIRGADLVFACIGPALEVFSRYRKVETADGREVLLPEYLEKVWEVVGRTALENILGTAEARARNGVAGALEEDARLTALFLWTHQATVTVDEGVGQGPEDEDESLEDSQDETGEARSKVAGLTLAFDVVRRFAQPLGIDLPKWEDRIIEIEKGVVRLVPVTERAQKLFGEDGADAVATRIEQDTALGVRRQLNLFVEDRQPELKVSIRGRSRRSGKRRNTSPSDEQVASGHETTTLDRAHAAMLLQASGRSNALRALLKAEQERGPEFLRLANALSALYPIDSEEKRLLDAMLLAVPR
jgi:adenine-specific DNA methylase